MSFLAAWTIPGVAVFAFTLFFAKLVAYTFLYWLPYYISTSTVGGRTLTPSVSERERGGWGRRYRGCAASGEHAHAACPLYVRCTCLLWCCVD